MHEKSLVPLLSSPFLSRPGGMHDALRATNVPVVLLPVACPVMRGAWRPGVLVEVLTGASWNLMSLHPGAWCVVVHCSQLDSACDSTACALLRDAWCVATWCPGVW